MKNIKIDNLKKMERELLNIEDDLVHQSTITGIKSYFYKWKLNKVLENLKKEENIFKDNKTRFKFLKVIFFKKNKKYNNTYEYMLELDQLVLKNQNILALKKIRYEKNVKSLNEDVIMQIFNEASIYLNDTLDIKKIDYKDKWYRNFVIDLYNLKIDERELNKIYQKAINILLEN